VNRDAAREQIRTLGCAAGLWSPLGDLRHVSPLNVRIGADSRQFVWFATRASYVPIVPTSGSPVQPSGGVYEAARLLLGAEAAVLSPELVANRNVRTSSAVLSFRNLTAG
jgi:hypothetical protein